MFVKSHCALKTKPLSLYVYINSLSFQLIVFLMIFFYGGEPLAITQAITDTEKPPKKLAVLEAIYSCVG